MEGREIVAFAAALIAAVLAYTKLIADKESKISDFRKDWINSLREALSEMLGEAYTISGRIRIRVKHAETVRAAAVAAAAAAAAAEAAKEASGAATTDEGANTAAEPGGSHIAAVEDAAAQRAVGATSDAAANIQSSDSVDAAPAQDAKGAGTDAAGGSEAPTAGATKDSSKPKQPLLTEEQVVELEKDLTDHWHSLRKAHRAILLHLNFGETASGLREFKEVELEGSRPAGVWKYLVDQTRIGGAGRSFDSYKPSQNRGMSDAAVLLVDQLELLVEKLLGEYDEVGEEKRYDEIKKAISDATLLGNLVLKPEWNRIKDGEPKFNNVLKQLKRLALGGLAFLLLFVFIPKKQGDSATAQRLIIDVSQRQEAPMTCPEMLDLRDRWRGVAPVSSSLPWCPPSGL